MTRVVFVNRFYWPETPATGQLLTDLAEGLAGQGWPVTVITGRGGASPAREIRNGVEIVRARGAGQGSSTAAKLGAFMRFGVGALLSVRRHVRRNDVVVCLTDPPLLGVGVTLLARLRGARVVHWAHDIYPEVAVAVSGHRWLQLLAPVRNLAWRAAEKIVTLGPSMAAVVQRAGVAPARIRTIANWAPAGLRPLASDDPAVAALRREWGLQGRLVIGYSGNLGRVHALDPILELAGHLRHDPDLAFVFIGGGPQRDSLQRRVTESGLPNVRFLPAQPRGQLAASLSVPDVHLVTLKPGCEAVVYPSKLYGIAAVARPVAFIGDRGSDIGQAVQRHGLGLVVGDGGATAAAALATFVRDGSARAAAGRSALAFAAANSFDLALAGWNQTLHDVATPARAPSVSE